MQSDSDEAVLTSFEPDKNESIVLAIPVLSDNYVWLLSIGNNHYVVVDPGKAGPIEQKLTEKSGKIAAIVLTHWHADHVAGVKALLRFQPEIPVYGPKECEAEGLQLLVVVNQQMMTIGNRQLEVFAVPGHTMGHVVYYSPPYLFCGDTLFSAGCGRCFEGSPATLYASLQILAALPDETLLCPGHEYTEVNLRFARSVEPSNRVVIRYLKALAERSPLFSRTVPSSLGLERQINPFLRCTEPEIQRSLGWSNLSPSPNQVFAALRLQKDEFS